MNPQRSDVLILGGGVIGLACARYLLRAGRSVSIIERATVGGATSHGNCGTITPSHCAPLAAPGQVRQALGWLLRADAPFRVAPRLDIDLLRWFWRFSRQCNWREFERVTRIKWPLLQLARRALEDLLRDDGLDCQFETLGTLNVYRDARAFEHSHVVARKLAEVGMQAETIDGNSARAMEPVLNDSVVGAYYNRIDAHLRPDRYSAELARIIRAAGGIIQEATTITGFEIAAGRIAGVHTDRGKFAGRNVVLALGSWSPLMARQLELRIPIQPGKGYSITYARPQTCPRIPMTLKECAVCVTGWTDGYRLGSTMEFAGYDTRLNRKRLDALRRGAALYLHEPEGPEVVEEWYGWRPMTWDDLPILGRSGRLENLVVATGHGMLGVTMSAVTGLLMSELITGRPTSLDMAPLSPVRFGQ